MDGTLTIESLSLNRVFYLGCNMNTYIVFFSNGEIMQQEAIDSKHLYEMAKFNCRNERYPYMAAICIKCNPIEEKHDVPVWVMNWTQVDGVFHVSRCDNVENMKKARYAFEHDYWGDREYLDKLFNFERHTVDEEYLATLEAKWGEVSFDPYTGFYRH